MRSHDWTLFSTHGLVLFHIASNCDKTMREIAEDIQVTERRVAQVIHDLTAVGVISAVREGRRNRYVVNRDLDFNDPVLDGVRLGDLVEVLSAGAPESARTP